MSKIIPNTFQTPNYLVDDVLFMLTGEEVKVLVYTVRRTLGFQKRRERISVPQFARGLVLRDGTRVDSGTGLSEPAARKAIQALVAFNLVTVAKENDSHRNEGPLYELQLDESAVQHDALVARYTATHAAYADRASRARGARVVAQTWSCPTDPVLSDNTTPLLSDNTTPGVVPQQGLKGKPGESQEKPRGVARARAPHPRPSGNGNEQTTGGSLVPEAFQPRPSDLAWAAEHAPGINIAHETAKFIAKNLANEVLGLRWHMRWRSWMLKAVEFAARDAQQMPVARGASRPTVTAQGDGGPKLDKSKLAFLRRTHE